MVIYKIINLCNGKIYVGSSCNMYKRLNQHITGVRGCNKSLHLDILKYGEDNFGIEMLEDCSGWTYRQLHWLEYLWIKRYSLELGESQSYNEFNGEDTSVFQSNKPRKFTVDSKEFSSVSQVKLYLSSLGINLTYKEVSRLLIKGLLADSTLRKYPLLSSLVTNLANF